MSCSGQSLFENTVLCNSVGPYITGMCGMAGIVSSVVSPETCGARSLGHSVQSDFLFTEITFWAQQTAVDGKGFSHPKWLRGPFTVSLLWDHMMSEGVKVSRQLVLVGWGLGGLRAGPHAVCTERWSKYFFWGGKKLKSSEAVCLYEMDSGVPGLPTCYKHPQCSKSSFVIES